MHKYLYPTTMQAKQPDLTPGSCSPELRPSFADGQHAALDM